MKSNSKETNRIKEPSKFAIKFANTVFMLGILFSVLVVVYAVNKIYYNPKNVILTFYFSFLLFAVLSAALFVLGLRKLRDELKVNMSVLFIIVAISVYGFEIFLMFPPFSTENSKSLKTIAEEMGVPFDKRTKLEVLDDLIDSGINAYPNVGPKSFLDGKIYTLGGISNITTIFGNEGGYYPVIETDEHGFNNPKGLYEVNKLDIVLTGDSFTEGYSVHSDENISAVLRDSGFNVISIGKAGNGPLLELAALKEYAEPIKPKIVLWMYFVNDYSDLIREKKLPILQKYLNDNEFSQNLISRQEEIDSLLVDYVEDEWKREREREREWEWEWERFIYIIKLSNIRSRINLIPTNNPLPTPTIFKDILKKSNQMVSEWGGKMFFVYLPDIIRYSKEIEHKNRVFVLIVATEMDIPIIDIHKEVFVPHPDPLSLFPFRSAGHYNSEGYRLVAESIVKRLKADGMIPLNSRN